jgi:hypothetical protein
MGECTQWSPSDMMIQQKVDRSYNCTQNHVTKDASRFKPQHPSKKLSNFYDECGIVKKGLMEEK